MKEINFKEFIDKFKSYPNDLVGLDIAGNSLRAVRMRRVKNEITLVGAALLDAPKYSIPKDGDNQIQVPAIDLPINLKGKYVAICLTGESSVIKLLSFPGPFDDDAADKIVSSMGIDDPDSFRIGYKLITEGHGKTESKVLAVAMPEIEASIAVEFFPSGIPAPHSIEVSGLAVMTSFLNGPGLKHKDDAVGIIDFGTNITTFALYHKDVLALIRRFDFGSDMIVNKIQDMLGVDRETAEGIINDGAFDISQAVSEVMEPLSNQIVVSRDFVERRENCHVSKIYVTGSLISSLNAMDEIHNSVGLDIDTWNPFDGLNVAPDALGDDINGQEWQFCAAVGACLATFEEE